MFSHLKKGIIRIVKRWLTRTPRRVRVVIYGTHSSDWMTALGPAAEVWKLLPEVREVLVLQGDEKSLPEPQESGLKTVVIPLMEKHALACPQDFPKLTASRYAIETLGNKLCFAHYVIEQRLESLSPPLYLTNAGARYPCVVKRTDLNAGAGIAVAESELDLARILEEDLWKGRPYILQSYVKALSEYVTHCTCRNGRIVWSCTYEYDLGAITIRNMALPTRSVAIKREALQDLERFLSPLSYTGPCNFDYRMREDGTPAVFEINPRLGGSLMRPENLEDLRQALSSIIDSVGQAS